MGQQWYKRGNLKILIPWDKRQWKHNHTKYMGCNKSSSYREVYSDMGLLLDTRKISNTLAYHLKESEREEQTKPKVRRKKEITKIREEIKKIQIEKAIEEIKLRDGSLKG